MAHEATRRRYTDFGLNTDDGFVTSLPPRSDATALPIMELEASSLSRERDDSFDRGHSPPPEMSTQTASDGMTINSWWNRHHEPAFNSLEEALARGSSTRLERH